MFDTELKKVQMIKVSKNLTPLTIVGTKPLLVDRQPYIGMGEKLPKYSDEEKFIASLYSIPEEEGWYGFPASGIKASAVSAGRFISSLSMVEIRGLFFVNPQIDGLLKIYSGSGDSPAIPVIDRQMIKKKDGKSIPAVRARFDEWQITFEVVYNPSMISIESIVQIYGIAGEMVGVGCRRPERSGIAYYGTYQLQ